MVYNLLEYEDPEGLLRKKGYYAVPWLTHL